MPRGPVSDAHWPTHSPEALERGKYRILAVAQSFPNTRNTFLLWAIQIILEDISL